jgi:hypothetical protein
MLTSFIIRAQFQFISRPFRLEFTGSANEHEDAVSLGVFFPKAAF